MLIFYPLFFLAMSLPFLAGSQISLFISLAIMGATLSILELGMNVSADLYEKQRKKTGDEPRPWPVEPWLNDRHNRWLG